MIKAADNADLRDKYLMTGLFVPDAMVLNYTHFELHLERIPAGRWGIRQIWPAPLFPGFRCFRLCQRHHPACGLRLAGAVIQRSFDSAFIRVATAMRRSLLAFRAFSTATISVARSRCSITRSMCSCMA